MQNYVLLLFDELLKACVSIIMLLLCFLFFVLIHATQSLFLIFHTLH